MQRIKISKPYTVKTEQNKYRLCAEFQEEGRSSYVAWYEVDPEYKDCLCAERADAFVVALLPYALRRNLEIICEQAVSERLYYHLNQVLLPTLGSQVKGFHKIRVTADVSNTVLPSRGARGASLSGGVDSFYTLLNHRERKEPSYNITHLTFFNVGASGDCGGDEARKLFHSRLNWIKDAAKILNVPIVCVDSNISEYLGLTHVSSHTYRTLSAVLALQKLFSGYFFASGYPYQKFHFTQEPAAYDLLNLQCLQTENTAFHLSGAEKTRMEKIDFISDYEITYRFLNVCVSEASNCSNCPKCRRTMMGLHLLGKLQLYKGVFDTEGFQSSLNTQIADACAYRKEVDWDELFLELKQRKIVKPYHYVYGAVRAFLRKCINKEGKIRELYLKIRPALKKR